MVSDRNMDSDEEEDFHLPNGVPATGISERRRAQKAIFDAWLTSDAAQQALRSKTRDSKIADVADEEQSIQSLNSRQSGDIVGTCRDSQRY